MKTIKTSLRVSILMAFVPLFALSGLFSQVPQKMSYQAVIRNHNDILVKNTQVGMEISILQGSADGPVIYTEIQTPVTNMNGMISIEIGGEAGFSTIDWLAGPFFLKTEIAIEAPLTNYTITGTSQILSVPYANAAHTAYTFDKLTSRGALVCNESNEGSIRYNTDNRSVEYCNGSNWVTLGFELKINFPTVNTSPASSITAISANSGGSISNNGGGEVIQKGVCWGTDALPAISGSKTLQGTGSDSFVSSLTGLVNNTLYFTRAYSTNILGTGYGEERKFTTLASLTTTQASDITLDSYFSGGDIQAGGDQPILTRGVAYGTGTNPEISGSYVETGTGAGVFSSLISGLQDNTLYYLRAFATNAGGTNYGNQRSTATLSKVISVDQFSATTTSITAGGEVTPGGGASISARGIAFGTSENPDISGTKTNNGSGTGVFGSTASGLVSNSLYNYRAYATNIGGTSYGENKTATTLAALTTQVAIERTANSFVTGGDIKIGGGQTISERGVVYDTNNNPTIQNNKVVASESGTGGFSVTISDISTGLYYYRAYAINAGGESYGNENPTAFDRLGAGFTDSRDGNSYATVWIGDKEWMAENLKYLPSVVGPGAMSEISPNCYVYGNNGTSVANAKSTVNYHTYGVLYNWPAAMDACPAGWHLPEDEEWANLENYLIASGYNYDGTTTGSKIAKSLATADGWSSYNIAGTIGNNDYPDKRNAAGFSALPGGGRGNDGAFYSIGDFGSWWSASEGGANHGWARNMVYDRSNVSRHWNSKALGYSVRCIRD